MISSLNNTKVLCEKSTKSEIKKSTNDVKCEKSLYKNVEITSENKVCQPNQNKDVVNEKGSFLLLFLVNIPLLEEKGI